jgi:hypothetical protein
MRMKLLAVFVAASCWSGPAAADMTARYSYAPGGPVVMTVEVNDRGDSRISGGSRMAAITVDGVAWVATGDLDGVYAVRRDDMFAAMEEVAQAMARATLPPEFANLPPPSEDETSGYRAVERGTITIAGRSGTRWLLASRVPRPRDSMEPEWVFVVSDDPQLAPIGRAIARQFRLERRGFSMSPAGGEFGGALPPEMLAVVQRGTLIGIDGQLYLRSVETAPVPPSAFTLPPTLLTREQFKVRAGFTLPTGR